MTTKLRLTAKLIPIVAPFVAHGDIRYYLNGINVRPHPNGGAVICATNGHALGAIYDPDAICSAEVTLYVGAATIRACGQRISEECRLELSNGRLTVFGKGGAEYHIQAGNPFIETDAFPKYERLIPDPANLTHGLRDVFARNVLAHVDKASIAAAKAEGKSPNDYCATQYFSTGDEYVPSIARLHYAPNFIALLMSMRNTTRYAPMPDWATALPRGSAADMGAPA